MKNTFVLSDESINSNKFIVLTNGIDLSRFKKNPIMYYMHERYSGGIIGRWDNIRVEGTLLLGDPVFDEKNTVGKQVKEKVDSGFLRSASIGISDVETQNINGVDTVVKCVLNEASIVDVPSNPNAVKLFKKSGKSVFQLSDLLEEPANSSFKEQILKLLELNNNESEDRIIDVLKLSINQRPELLKQALQFGYIDKKEMELLNETSKNNFNYVLQYIAEKKQSMLNEIPELVKKSCNEGKFTWYDRSIFEQIGLEIGAKKLKKLLSIIPNQIKITDLIEGGKDNDRKNWGLDEYRKYAPNMLKENPGLYEKLLIENRNKIK